MLSFAQNVLISHQKVRNVPSDISQSKQSGICNMIMEYQVLVNRLSRRERDVFHCTDYFSAKEVFCSEVWTVLFRGTKVLEDNPEILKKAIDYLPSCLVIDLAVRLDFYGIQTDVLLVHVEDEK